MQYVSPVRERLARLWGFLTVWVRMTRIRILSFYAQNNIRKYYILIVQWSVMNDSLRLVYLSGQDKLHSLVSIGYPPRLKHG